MIKPSPFIYPFLKNVSEIIGTEQAFLKTLILKCCSRNLANNKEGSEFLCNSKNSRFLYQIIFKAVITWSLLVHNCSLSKTGFWYRIVTGTFTTEITMYKAKSAIHWWLLSYTLIPWRKKPYTTDHLSQFLSIQIYAYLISITNL